MSKNPAPRLRFTFGRQFPMAHVEDALDIAALAAESIHGRVALKTCTSFALDAGRRTCTIDTSADVGIAMARVFAGLLEHGHGIGSFQVDRPAEARRKHTAA